MIESDDELFVNNDADPVRESFLNPAFEEDVLEEAAIAAKSKPTKITSANQ